MAIKAADLFRQKPDSFLDFSAISPAAIFNRSVVPRTNGLLQLFGPEDEQEAPEMTPMGSSAPQDVSARFGPTAFEEPETDFLPPPREAPAVRQPVAEPETDYNAAPQEPAVAAAPNVAAQGQGSGDFADFMFESEARKDSQGRLQVYNPPSGDGGGAYEVAGITATYQPKEAARLKAMIDAGRNDEAVAAAKDFYRQRAAPFTSLTQNKGLQLQLADTVHHRGEGGLRRVLQRATGSDDGDYGALINQLSTREDALDAFHSARQAYEWEEVDRGRASRKKFRKGLQNRFNKADSAARQFL